MWIYKYSSWEAGVSAHKCKISEFAQYIDLPKVKSNVYVMIEPWELCCDDWVVKIVLFDRHFIIVVNWSIVDDDLCL